MSKFSIIKAGLGQIEDIIQIAHATWPATYAEILSQEQLAYMLNRFYNKPYLSERMQQGNLFYLVRQGAAFAGFMELGINDKEGYTKLHKLYVLPEAQGLNLGRLLLDEAIIIAKQAAQAGIFLNVNRYNKARTFYEKLGFELIETVDIHIGNGFYMNDFIMQLNFK
ncbi:MAG: N-acetyltransferase [Sphingobacteriales bacterium]|nr:MAG: N-acetyltransferase [Sphingobacteriales bacterium]